MNPAMVTIAGIAASRGFAAGPVFVHRPDSTFAVPEYSAAMSTTVRPVTHTAEQAVKSATRGFPHVPAARAQGVERTNAPTMISARKPRAMEERRPIYFENVPFSLSQTAQMESS